MLPSLWCTSKWLLISLSPPLSPPTSLPSLPLFLLSSSSCPLYLFLISLSSPEGSLGHLFPPFALNVLQQPVSACSMYTDLVYGQCLSVCLVCAHVCELVCVCMVRWIGKGVGGVVCFGTIHL